MSTHQTTGNPTAGWPSPPGPVGLYVHIPFCERKCHYCDFLSRPGSPAQMESYLDLLARNAARFHPRIEVDTVFVGGGTPSALPPPLLRRFLDEVLAPFRTIPGAEVSLECNPESFDAEKARILADGGVNRISFGFQSTDPGELQDLGRIHSRDRAFEAFAQARAAGFTNVNVDLIYGFPGHGLASWDRTLDEVLALGPEHLSTYCFILEEDTLFHRLSEEGALAEPDEDLQCDLYERTVGRLAEAGYEQYEISNHALPGRSCRHNLKYWSQQESIGIGIGAVSFVGGARRSCARSMEEYRRQVLSGREWSWAEEPMPRDLRLKETVMLGLRTMEGVDLGRLAGAPLSPAESTTLEELLSPWVSRGLLDRDHDRYRLTPRGVFLSNEVFTDLV